MTPDPQHIAQLVFRYLSGTIDDRELEELQEWIALSPYHRRFMEEMDDDLLPGKLVMQAMADEEQDIGNVLKQRVRSQLEFEGRDPVPGFYRMPNRRKWWAAASILLLIMAGGYFWTKNKSKGPQAPLVTVATKEIRPGAKGAILTLADGSQLVLDSLSGVVAYQNGSQAVLRNGQLSYDPAGKAEGGIAYNTMSTPRGRQFQVNLPDGTRVWLNAASSIRFPTVFTGNERQVEVSGEVYFEVAKNMKQPFRVKVNEQVDIEVLGTSFNVNAYTDEPSVNTTLIEGKVKVMAAEGAVILTPGKQAQVKDGKAGVAMADTDKVMAWKNGWFNFEGLSLPEIMRQLERWYDIEVLYPSGVPELALNGEMTMDVTLQGLLRGLKELGLHYKLEGKQLIILP
jgi:ferric-dicitrate binding protein FerR (iron transport regulator)